MFKPGDIVINNAGAFGHVLMCYGEENDDGVGAVTFIHGTNSGNFSVVEKVTAVNEVKNDFWHFSPKGLGAGDKQRLIEVADAIKKTAKYGKYRAVRLLLGDSGFGPQAQSRLNKYRTRLKQGGDKLVSTITCSEAIVLCYQLSFDNTSPLFIGKDAAHVMPRTLAKYLRENPRGWTMLQAPR